MSVKKENQQSFSHPLILKVTHEKTILILCQNYTLYVSFAVLPLGDSFLMKESLKKV